MCQFDLRKLPVWEQLEIFFCPLLLICLCWEKEPSNVMYLKRDLKLYSDLPKFFRSEISIWTQTLLMKANNLSSYLLYFYSSMLLLNVNSSFALLLLLRLTSELIPKIKTFYVIVITNRFCVILWKTVQRWPSETDEGFSPRVSEILKVFYMKK